MRIERIDDNTVKCFLSNEELDAYEITYKDFVARSEKAKVVMEEIIEQAEEEVGYQPPRYSFDLQIMMLPDQGMILTFSEKEPDEKRPSEGLLECLKEMKQMLEEKKANRATGRIEIHKEIAGRPSPEQDEGNGDRHQKLKGADDGSSGDQEPAAPAKGAEKKDMRPTFAVFSFPSLQRVCAYAGVLPAGLRIRSALYHADGEYYLFLEKGTASYERYSRACIQAMEFGEIFTAEKDRVLYLEEHGECIVRDHAVKKLKLDS